MIDVTPAWRSMLFIPVLNERFLGRASQRGADAIQLDLEDAIPPSQKLEARRAVPAAAASLAAQGLDVVVRINRPWRQAVADIEAAVGPDVCCLTLPKVPNVAHVRAIAEILDEVESDRGMSPGHTRLVVMIETAGPARHACDRRKPSSRTRTDRWRRGSCPLSRRSPDLRHAIYP